MIHDHPVRRASAGMLLATSVALAGPVAVAAQEPADPPVGLPATIAGQPLAAETFSGEEWLARFSAGEAEDLTFVEGTQGLLDGVGKTPADLTVTTALVEVPSPEVLFEVPDDGTGEEPVDVPIAADNIVTVTAITIDGVESRLFVQDAAKLMLGDVVSPELVLRPIGGKWVLRVLDAEQPGVYPRTIYLKDDTAWIMQGDEEYVWEALGQLPDVVEPPAADVEPIALAAPLDLDGRRRTGLYEATEPLFLPTLSERQGPELEQWMRDLYLAEGVSPAEFIGLIVWWGVESSQESVQIEGYQLPGAAEDSALVARLADDVILGSDEELPEGVTRTKGEVGGRQVVTLDFGAGAQQHVFRSGDTVWVVTDHVGEPEMAAEAIAALP